LLLLLSNPDIIHAGSAARVTPEPIPIDRRHDAAKLFPATSGLQPHFSFYDLAQKVIIINPNNNNRSFRLANNREMLETNSSSPASTLYSEHGDGNIYPTKLVGPAEPQAREFHRLQSCCNVITPALHQGKGSS
jgi:hypothetical protein